MCAFITHHCFARGAAFWVHTLQRHASYSADSFYQVLASFLFEVLQIKTPSAVKLVCCGRCKVSSMAEEGSSNGTADIDSLAAEFDAECQALLQTCPAADDNDVQ